MAITLQKANLWKRISAYMFDAVIAFTLALIFALSASSIIGYDLLLADYGAHVDSYYAKYSEQYGINLELSDEDYNKMSQAEKDQYDTLKTQALTELNEEMNDDEEIRVLYGAIFAYTMVIVSVGALLSILVVYFIVPLILKEGRTLGKKIFGLAVIRTHCVKISSPVLFARSIVGLYAMETMFPVYLLLMIAFNQLGTVGIVMLLLFAALQIGVMFKTPTNSCIHDLLSDSVVVDFSSQQIFETEEERIAFLKAEAEKDAQDAQYK